MIYNKAYGSLPAQKRSEDTRQLCQYATKQHKSPMHTIAKHCTL